MTSFYFDIEVESINVFEIKNCSTDAFKMPSHFCAHAEKSELIYK